MLFPFDKLRLFLFLPLGLAIIVVMCAMMYYLYKSWIAKTGKLTSKAVLALIKDGLSGSAIMVAQILLCFYVSFIFDMIVYDNLKKPANLTMFIVFIVYVIVHFIGLRIFSGRKFFFFMLQNRKQTTTQGQQPAQKQLIKQKIRKRR